MVRLGSESWNLPVTLAPMAGVTDGPFRLLCREQGCDLTYTEMVSAKGLYYRTERTEELLQTAPGELPCGAQLFGSDPEILAAMARKVAQEGQFTCIDLNMGCPVKKIVQNGEGSALMRDMQRAEAVIRAVVQSSPLPVTVKFRKGWDEDHQNGVEFAQMAQQAGAAMVTVHARTREQGYSGQADWDFLARVKQAVTIPVIGNGDVFCAADAVNLLRHTGCDGVAVARGALGNPWLFREIKAALRGEDCPSPTNEERLSLILRHLRMETALAGDHGVIRMRKHICWYTRGVRDGVKVRVAANQAATEAEMTALLRQCFGG